MEAFGVTNTPQFFFTNGNGTQAGVTLGSSSFGQITQATGVANWNSRKANVLTFSVRVQLQEWLAQFPASRGNHSLTKTLPAARLNVRTAAGGCTCALRKLIS